MATATLGWTIGATGAAVARVGGPEGGRRSARWTFERLPQSAEDLAVMLTGLAREVGAGPGAAHALATTLERSPRFHTRREGIAFVLDAFAAAFPHSPLHVWASDGSFATPVEARNDPLLVSASGWLASATVVAAAFRDVLLVRVGGGETDVVPIEGGRVTAQGRTDTTRLHYAELVPTGAVGTPVEAVARTVPLWDGESAVVADRLALMGDVHLWRGGLEPADYRVSTPDGRAASRACAGERIARLVGADAETLSEESIGYIAAALAATQVAQIAAAIERARTRCRPLQGVVVAGTGDFIAAEAARGVGLPVARLRDRHDGLAARSRPAAAVAELLARMLDD